MKKAMTAVLAFATVMFGLELTLRPVSEPDLFFYFAVIERYLRDGVWPHIDPFLFPLADEPLYTLHQWLGYSLFYLPFRALGWSGVVLEKTLLVCALFTLPLWIYRNRRLALPALWPVFWTLTLFSTHHRFRERASLWGDLCLEILAAGLFFWREQKWFWRGMPLLFVLWAQVHPSYPLGFALLFFFICVEPRLAREKWIFISLSFLAPLLNPMWIEGYLYPFRFAIESGPELKKNIMEWLPLWDPRARPFVFLYIPFFSLVPWLLYRIWQAGWRRHLWGFAIVLFSVALAAGSIRFGLSAQLLLLLLFVYLENEHPLEISLGSLALSAVVVLGVLWLKVPASPWVQRPLSDRFGIDALDVPVEAAEFIHSHPPEMKIFNSFKYGGYLAWAWQGRPPIFFHGFSTNFKFFDENYLAPQENAAALSSLIQRFDLGVFVLSKSVYDQDFIRLLEKRDDWQILWQNRETVIFARRDPRVFR